MPSDNHLLRRRARIAGLAAALVVTTIAAEVIPADVATADEPHPAIDALSRVVSSRSADAAGAVARLARVRPDAPALVAEDAAAPAPAPEPPALTAREQIAEQCPDLSDPDVLRDGAAADGRGLCVRSVHRARSDTAAAAVVEGFGRLGLPYSRGRRGRDGYDDCSSFIGKAYRSAGRPLSESDWEPSSSVMRNAGWADVVEEPLPGDILWRSGHVAMALADGYLMHASQSGDVTHVRQAGRYRRVLAVAELPATPPHTDPQPADTSPAGIPGALPEAVVPAPLDVTSPGATSLLPDPTARPAATAFIPPAAAD